MKRRRTEYLNLDVHKFSWFENNITDKFGPMPRRQRGQSVGMTKTSFIKVIALILLQFCRHGDAQNDEMSTGSQNSTATPDASVQPLLSMQPSPTATEPPTTMPTKSPMPSFSPTESLAPSWYPTVKPTVSSPPSSAPSVSAYPTKVASSMPSTTPTLTVETNDRSRFRQRFLVASKDDFLNDTEIAAFESVIEGYTEFIAPAPAAVTHIETECKFNLQAIFEENNQTINEVDYTVSYLSRTTDVSNYTYMYSEYVNSNLQVFAVSLQKVDVPILEAQEVLERQIQSPAPSISLSPSSSPSIPPTISSPPTYAPSYAPSARPSPKPQPTLLPTMAEYVFPPTNPPAIVDDNHLSVGAVAAIVVLGGAGVLAGLLYYYRSSKKKQLEQQTGATDERNRGPRRPDAGESDEEAVQNLVLSPTESLLTNKSLLSAGDSDLNEESGDEIDNTKNLQDEFDQYKDQNLEQFRDDVEGKVPGMESVMSAAVTMAHMVDDSMNLNEAELRWGCSRGCSGIDIEATALFEVSDWIKRNENAPTDRRRSFLQEMLNKMVTSVKNGVLNADDGSRTIHESAALLGLQLAEALPMTTVIVSGMRKAATADDLTKAFREFGDVDVAAVASGSRGFGIVRFRRPKSVERAMRHYTTSEIVIQDVAVQIKVLLPSGFMDNPLAGEIHD